MKTLRFWAILCLTALVACNSKEKTYIIEGYTVEEMEGREVYLTDYVGDICLDTAVVQDGIFHFEGVVDTPFLAVVEDGEYSLPFIIETGDTIFVDMVEYTPVMSTPLNDALCAYNASNAVLLDVYAAEVDSIKLLAGRGKIGRREALARLDEKEQEVENRFNDIAWSTIAAHPGDIVGAIAFHRWLINKERDIADIDSAMQRVSPTLLSFPIVRDELEIIRNLALSAVGMPYRDFTVATPTDTASLSQYVGCGSPTLALFWMQGDDVCPGDVADMHRIYAHKGLTVVGISMWNNDTDTVATGDSIAVPWPQILGAYDTPANLYAINSTPYTILFAGDGTIVARGLRGAQLRKAVAAAVMQ